MEFNDQFLNFVTGLGTRKDKATHGHFHFHHMTTKMELDAAYRTSWLCGTIVDAPADDMTREWRRWLGGKRQVAALKLAEKRLKVRTVVNKAMKMARLYGGSAILIGDGSEDPTQELDFDRIKKNGLKYVHALSRWEAWSGQLDRDPMSEWFGSPLWYELTSPEMGALQIHPSRIIRFEGIPWLELMYAIDGWGFSILERVLEAARDVHASCGNLASMTYEGKLDVIKIKGLTQNVTSADYREKLLTRFAAANMNKSVNNALILDAEEEWEQKTLNLSNMPEAIRTLLEVVAGAANMPVTRLLGTSPKGLNATGQSELRNYYDMLAGKQEIDLSPQLDRLDRALIRSAGVGESDCHYEWLPLWQMTEAEIAAINMQDAQSNQIYATMGVCAPSALRKGIQAKLIQNKVYPGFQEALDEAGDEEPAPLVLKAAATGNEIDTPSATARPAKTDSATVPVPKGSAVLMDAEPRTLYVSRPVLNAAEIMRWARKQGIPNLLSAKQLHVTLAYSHGPVDWFRAYSAESKVEIPAGGARLVEPLGGEGALVLLFASDTLTWRWQHFRHIGADWKHGDEFQPHVTLSWNAPNINLRKVQPYQGRIVLGPERFAEIDENWREQGQK